MIKLASCYLQIDKALADEGYTVYFIPSGFKKQWLKVSECHDYSLNVSYASEEEANVCNTLWPAFREMSAEESKLYKEFMTTFFGAETKCGS